VRQVRQVRQVLRGPQNLQQRQSGAPRSVADAAVRCP
jgi:hypothetical protein